MKYPLPFLLLLSCLIVACSDGGDTGNTGGGSDPKSEPSPSTAPVPPTPHEEGLREFTGARTKAVWTQYQNPDKIDKQGTSRHHHLYAIDTADGRGEHKVLEEEGSYAFPIITPDGEQIVFTRKVKIKKGDKRTFEPRIVIVNFDGSGLKELRDGYAQEVWEDPETGKYWVYAGDRFVLSNSTAPICKRIIRFPLDDPSHTEVVWDRTQIGTDSFAISADGKRFAGLFPWPKGGLADLEAMDWEPLTNGCWVSIAPDNSYRSWVFDGPHKNLYMFDADAQQTAVVQVNSHPHIKGHEVYHPRWSNHPRFFAISGPHTSGAGKKNRGKPVEIFLGRFSPELDEVEEWFRVSNNSLPDGYPDIWIDPEGVRASVAEKVKPDPAPAKKIKWPSQPQGLVFKWENVQAKNEFTSPDGSNQVTELAPSGRARYGPNYEMLVDGGNFEPVLDSAASLERRLAERNIHFQGLVTADAHGGYIFRSGEIALHLQEESLGGEKSSRLKLALGEGAFLEFAELELGEPTHICINYTAEAWSAYINGREIPVQPGRQSAIMASSPGLSFGSRFDGSLENIAFYDRPISAEEAATDYALMRSMLDQRKPIERLEVKGKLVATSPLPTLENIKPYVRALVYYVYETDDPKLGTIAVTHWAILDETPVAGLPREIGKTYDLTIESKFSHPELSSQAESNDEEKIDPLLMLYHDVTTPNQ